MTTARSSDPETSHEAARSISKVAVTRLHLAILMVLSPGQGHTMPVRTDEQIANTIRGQNDLLAHYTDTNFRSRRSELVKLGLVEQSTGWYGTTRSGRRACLWRITPAGLNHLNGVS